MAKYKGRNVDKIQDTLWVFDRSYAHLVSTLSLSLRTTPERIVCTFEDYGFPRNSRLDRMTSETYRRTLGSLEDQQKRKEICTGLFPLVEGARPTSQRDLMEHLQSEPQA
jgi:hypothetical protein